MSRGTHKESYGLVSLTATEPRTRPDRLRPVTLTHRQSEVLTLVLQGKTDRQIAAELFVAESTIASHLHALHQRFGVKNRMALCRAALICGTIVPHKAS